MAYELPALPYPLDALAPHLSPETLEFHHGKHHNSYVVNLNKLLDGKPQPSLEELIKTSSGGVFNNAAQIWNHTFYWNSMSPKGGGEPKDGPLKTEIMATWGSFAAFKEAFSNACVTQFGSGWGWLVLNPAGKLEIMQTSNAENPLTKGSKPLLTCDVWEHAYYIDYRNLRPKYVETFWNLVNWDFAEENFKN
jgi:superoxide dismutase, Fe-Mn family